MVVVNAVALCGHDGVQKELDYSSQLSDPSKPRVKAAYRKDIDGLRAIAILPVLFFHSGIQLFSGGYVGVDVFFVISGFLIAGIIAREVDEGRFSIVRFYERRARRIIPALFAVMAVTLLGVCILYLPADFAKASKSALLTTLFLSNVGFFLETGYFAGSADSMPLLHTWSLAVEEQFYIGFPILLILIARWLPHWRTAIIAGLGIGSFTLAVITQSSGTGFAFYLLPPRAWELFVGALLATATLPQMASRFLREVVAFAGIAAIAYAAFFFTRTTVFPGINALFPVLGAAALIACAPGTLTGRLLETPLMVGIGLISYSLYLWHWPLIVFAEYSSGMLLKGTASVAIILLSLCAAILSWRFIERPFRSQSGFDRRFIFVSSGLASASLAIAALAMMMAQGWPARFSERALRVAQAEADISPVRGLCITSEISGARPRCTLGAPAEPTMLLWGDSHGVELAWAISERIAKRDASLIQRTRSSCPPILRYASPKDPGCNEFNNAVRDLILANPKIETIILAAFWESDNYRSRRNRDDLDATIRALLALHRRVVLVGPVPAQDFDVPRHLATIVQKVGSTDLVGTSKKVFLEQSAWISGAFAHWRAMGVIIVEPANTMCDQKLCFASRKDTPLYFDSHHLSLFGARVLVSANTALQ
jgi:peptidoglycan/LPS O-acetylase OafA/YrhL